MERIEIFNEVCKIFKSVLNNNDLNIIENYTAEDVEGWDSLTHIMLVVSIEKRFNMKFLSNEITTWKNIGEMIDSIYSKTK
jgi:acyl carrier protein